MAGYPYHRGSMFSGVSDSSGGSGGAGAAGRSGRAAEDDIDDYSDAPSALQQQQQQQQQQQPWREGAGGGGYGGAPHSPSSSQRGSASPSGTAHPPRAGPQAPTGMTDSTEAGARAGAGAGAGAGGGHGKRQVLLMGPKAEEVLRAAATPLDSVTNDAKPTSFWSLLGSFRGSSPKPLRTFTMPGKGNIEARGHRMEDEHTYFAIWVQSLDSEAVRSALAYARKCRPDAMPFKEVSHIVLLPVVPSTQRRAVAASSSNSPTGGHNRQTNRVDDSIGRAESARRYLATQGVNVSILALADDPLTVRKAPHYSVVDGGSEHAIREAIEEMTRFVDRRSVLNDLDLSPDGAREPAARSTGAPGSAAVTHLRSPSAPGTAAAPAAAAAAGGMPTPQSPHESRKQPQQLSLQQSGYTAASTSAMDVAATSEEFDYETLRRSQDPDRALVKQRLEATNARLDDIAQYVLKMAESTNDPELVKEAQRLCAGDADADGGEHDASAAVVAAPAAPAAAGVPASVAGAPVAEPRA